MSSESIDKISNSEKELSNFSFRKSPRSPSSIKSTSVLNKSNSQDLPKLRVTKKTLNNIDRIKTNEDSDSNSEDDIDGDEIKHSKGLKSKIDASINAINENFETFSSEKIKSNLKDNELSSIKYGNKFREGSPDEKFDSNQKLNNASLNKNLKILENLLINESQKSENQRIERNSRDANIQEIDPLKNEFIKPNVKEMIEDPIMTEKLRIQREEKTYQRLQKTKSKSEAYKTIEKTIDQIQSYNEMDSRLSNLKEKAANLSYETKPVFDEAEYSSHFEGRTSSTYANRRKNKYSDVEAKVTTRILSASQASASQLENDDCLNSSMTIRNKVYYDWYEKKKSLAIEEKKNRHDQIKADEEKMARDLIEKLSKSKTVINAWNKKKNEEMFQKAKENKELLEKMRTEEIKLEEKKSNSKVAFEKWKENKKDHNNKTHKNFNEELTKAKQQSKEKLEESEKAFNLWKQKKNEEMKNRLQLSVQELKNREEENKLKLNNKKSMNDQAYEEWLTKKEKRKLTKSTSFEVLPPFYPSSRTIAFGR